VGAASARPPALRLEARSPKARTQGPFSDLIRSGDFPCAQPLSSSRVIWLLAARMTIKKGKPEPSDIARHTGDQQTRHCCHQVDDGERLQQALGVVVELEDRGVLVLCEQAFQVSHSRWQLTSSGRALAGGYLDRLHRPCCPHHGTLHRSCATRTWLSAKGLSAPACSAGEIPAFRLISSRPGGPYFNQQKWSGFQPALTGGGVQARRRLHSCHFDPPNHIDEQS